MASLGKCIQCQLCQKYCPDFAIEVEPKKKKSESDRMKRLSWATRPWPAGPLKAGMTFFAAYPITPASEIMHVLAEKENEIAFVHAEDEIASIHMAIGASLAGAQSHDQHLGAGHVPEARGHRSGPDDGSPAGRRRRPEGRAEHRACPPCLPRAISSKRPMAATAITPPSSSTRRSVEECYRYTIEAFNAAEESRSPVILLLDGFLAHLSETVDLETPAVSLKAADPRSPSDRAAGISPGSWPRTAFRGPRIRRYYREWYARVKTKMLEAAAELPLLRLPQERRAETLAHRLRNHPPGHPPLEARLFPVQAGHASSPSSRKSSGPPRTRTTRSSSWK